MDPKTLEQSNRNISTSPVLAPMMLPPKNFRYKMLVIVVGVVILGAIGYGGIWWWVNQQSAREATNMFSPWPSVPADSAANWKTYTNSLLQHVLKVAENV